MTAAADSRAIIDAPKFIPDLFIPSTFKPGLFQLHRGREFTALGCEFTALGRETIRRRTSTVSLQLHGPLPGASATGSQRYWEPALLKPALLQSGVTIQQRATSCFNGSQAASCWLLATHCWMKYIPSTPS